MSQTYEIRMIFNYSLAKCHSNLSSFPIANHDIPYFDNLYATVEPPRSGFMRSGHLPRPDMIFYEILTNIIYTSIGENIQHNKKQKKQTIKAGMTRTHVSPMFGSQRVEILYACPVSHVILHEILRSGHCSDGTVRISEVLLYIYWRLI